MAGSNKQSNRADRRAAAVEVAKRFTLSLRLGNSEKSQTQDKWSVSITCLVAVLATLSLLFPPQTTYGASIALVSLFLLALYPLFHFSEWAGIKKKPISAAISGVICSVLVFFIYKQIWPPALYYRELNEGERTLMTAILKSQKEPRDELDVRCPISREDLCIIASSYAGIFQRAGWKAKSEVNRGLYGRAMSGVVIAKRPAPGKVDPYDQSSGLWVQQSPSLVTIRKAFQAVGINAGGVAEEDLPEGKLIVYFGPPPPKQ